MAVKSHFSEVQIALLLDNKHEYTEHVCDHLSEVLVKSFQELYDKAYKSPLGRNKGSLEAFQYECEQVVSWNAELVAMLFKKIKNPSFSKLLKLVFMTYIKAILAQHGLRLEGRLQVRIPGAEHFVHKCAIEMARSLWKRPYLYYHKVRSLERQRNLHECDLIARKAIRIVLRQSIPMEQILQEIEMNNISETESEVETLSKESSEEDFKEIEHSKQFENQESDIDSEDESESEVETESKTELKVETKSEVEVEPEVEPESETESDSETDSEPEANADIEVEAESEQEVEVESKPEPEVMIQNEEPQKNELVNTNEDSDTETEEDIDASNPSTQDKDGSDDDRINGDSEDDRTVEWIAPSSEMIEVQKNETKEEAIIPPSPITVEAKTSLMGTRHLINPKRIKFVSSGKKDAFF